MSFQDDFRREYAAKIDADAADQRRRINTKHRISKNQRQILAVIADHTVNVYDYSSDGYCKTERGLVSYYKLRLECVSCWCESGAKTMRTVVSSFSRAVHSLIEAELVCGVALAWCWVSTEKELAKFDENPAIYRWQGGGRRRQTRTSEGDRPRLKLVGLTESGWEFVAKERKRAERRQRKLERQQARESTSAIPKLEKGE